MSFLVIVPTLNPADAWSAWIEALKSQSKYPDNVLIIDSDSKDDTVSLAKEAGFNVQVLPASEFNHGNTRKLAVLQNSHHEFVIFLTQDAILADAAAIKNILLPFQNKNIAAVCGRQLPRPSAGKIEAHARIYNYPDQSSVKTFEDRHIMGLKAVFLSNSFAAYRVSALSEVGGFPDDVIFGEDMYVAAKLLKAGNKIAYAADACVYHSHDYSIWQEFRRYFDMGVFHSREPWIREEFGAAEKQGVKFIFSEFNYLLLHMFWKIPEALLRLVFRFAGFRLGLAESKLPLWMKKRVCMNSLYFNRGES